MFKQQLVAVHQCARVSVLGSLYTSRAFLNIFTVTGHIFPQYSKIIVSVCIEIG
jgi:hypothetical protein